MYFKWFRWYITTRTPVRARKKGLYTYTCTHPICEVQQQLIVVRSAVRNKYSQPNASNSFVLKRKHFARLYRCTNSWIYTVTRTDRASPYTVWSVCLHAFNTIPKHDCLKQRLLYGAQSRPPTIDIVLLRTVRRRTEFSNENTAVKRVDLKF
jgi:hypothetical protein